ncbi:MAG: ComF family protein [Gemmatimonadales bacterium]|nr:ComF family protein [Gemmatimonadales bacterium]
MMWPDALRATERWLLAAECMSCGATVTEAGEPLVCEMCRIRWRALPDPVCVTCGEPTDLGVACRLCAGWPDGFSGARSAVRLDAPVRELIHAFKYDGWWRLAEVFAARMLPLLASSDGDTDLVPVPLSRRRRITRGYNQATRLADALGRLSGMPVDRGRICRLRDTATQTRLTPAMRMANLAGAFGVTPSARRAVLVDDVFTTGATLSSAATALLDGGAGAVSALTFARAAPPLTDAATRIDITTLLRSSEASV